MTGSSHRGARLGQRRWVHVGSFVLLCALVALAGCGGPLDNANATAADGSTGMATTSGTPPVDGTSATEPTPAGPAELRERGIDVRAVWNRTERIVGVEAERPATDVRNYAGAFSRTPLLTTLTGSGPGSHPETPAGSYLPNDERVVLIDAYVRDAPVGMVTAVLAHEYAHAIQFQQEWGAYAYPKQPETDRLVLTAYTEGFATYVEQRYAEQHTDTDPVATYWARYANASTYTRHRLGPYLYGYEYYERSVNETSSLASVASNRPVSTEQLLHGTDDTPRELELRVDYDGMNWSAAQQAPVGELFTRIVLRDELGKERAIAAAEGWGADRVRRLESRSDGLSGYVWVQRWDSTADADEFEAALGPYLDSRRSETDAPALESHRLAPETTALFVGNESLVESTAVVSASNASVRVAVGG